MDHAGNVSKLAAGKRPAKRAGRLFGVGGLSTVFVILSSWTYSSLLLFLLFLLVILNNHSI